jgi:hypothetical protein
MEKFINPLPHYNNLLPLKFPNKYSYYTNGSFYLPKVNKNGILTSKRASYGIFNLTKDLYISNRLIGLQNILHVELMAIHTIVNLSISKYSDEPIHIFIDSLNS